MVLFLVHLNMTCEESCSTSAQLMRWKCILLIFDVKVIFQEFFKLLEEISFKNSSKSQRKICIPISLLFIHYKIISLLYYTRRSRINTSSIPDFPDLNACRWYSCVGIKLVLFVMTFSANVNVTSTRLILLKLVILVCHVFKYTYVLLYYFYLSSSLHYTKRFFIKFRSKGHYFCSNHSIIESFNRNFLNCYLHQYCMIF